MDKTMIDNWNKTVPKNGLVIHLGDFAWGGYQAWKNIREQLNGDIILLKGNHDFKNGPQSQEQYEKLFRYTAQQLRIQIEGRKLWLNHFPLLCYSGVYRQLDGIEFNLFGHVHISNFKERNNGKDLERCMNALFATQYDVGVDFNNFTPISWNELNSKILKQIENNSNLKMWIQ